MPVRNILKLIAILSLMCPALQFDCRAQEGTQGAHKFDEFGDIEYSDKIARLDNFAIQLQQEPNARGFIIVYRTRRDLPGLSNRYALVMKNYMTGASAIPAERVITVDGGVASCLTHELWIAPPGSAPKARSDAYSNSFVDRDTARKIDEHYYSTPQDEVESYAVGYENLASKLDAFATALRQSPGSQAYLIAYAQNHTERIVESDGRGRERTYRRLRRDAPGTARRVLQEVKSYLIRTYRFAPALIKVVDGGHRSMRLVELWIVPRGASAPIPTPNQFPRRGKSG